MRRAHQGARLRRARGPRSIRLVSPLRGDPRESPIPSLSATGWKISWGVAQEQSARFGTVRPQVQTLSPQLMEPWFNSRMPVRHAGDEGATPSGFTTGL